jgi:hypothetical protein
MVFSINAPSSGANTFDGFLQLAKASNATLRTNGASSTTSTSKSIARDALIGILVGAAVLVLLMVLGCEFLRRRRRTKGIFGGKEEGAGLMGYSATSYRPLDEPSPEAAADMHLDYQPLVLPSDRRGEPSNAYDSQGRYDPPPPPPPPLAGQYSTAWDQNRF